MEFSDDWGESSAALAAEGEAPSILQRENSTDGYSYLLLQAAESSAETTFADFSKSERAKFLEAHANLAKEGEQ